jgi:hypothetical protein
MKYVCLGYIDEQKWDGVPESERNALMDQCFAYDDELRRSGREVGGEALTSARNATTLRYRNNQVLVTDGPFTETKEQLGGIFGFPDRNSWMGRAPLSWLQGMHARVRLLMRLLPPRMRGWMWSMFSGTPVVPQ